MRGPCAKRQVTCTIQYGTAAQQSPARRKIDRMGRRKGICPLFEYYPGDKNCHKVTKIVMCLPVSPEVSTRKLLIRVILCLYRHYRHYY